MNELQLQSIFQKADALLQQEVGDAKPVIAVWGLMNVGKSYLLNMLTDHIHEEFFRTRDVRETAALQHFETSGYIFLDTPGLDANEDDDAVANEGAVQADIVLFVHQSQGELEKIEIDFLRKLKESFGVYAEKNIILILSKADSGEPVKVSAIEKRMLEQCQELLNFKPCCFQISGTRFRNGMMKNQDGLVRASHIQELKAHIDAFNVDTRMVKLARQRQALDTLIAEIDLAARTLQEGKIQIEETLARSFAPFNKALARLSVSLNKTADDYNSL